MKANSSISWQGLIYRTRMQFGDYARQGQAKAAPNRGMLARLRHGLTVESETRAYGDVLPYVDRKSEQDAALRTAAIAASHPTLQQSTKTEEDGAVVTKHKALGTSCREISVQLALKNGAPIDVAYMVDPDRPDPIAQRLMQLPGEDLDGAALAINRILTLGDSLAVTVDYFDIARLLARWGKGVTEGSLAIRRSPLRDYYSYIQPKTKD